MSRFLFIALGAALGANARYLVGLWAAGRLGATFPYGTLVVNVLGSLALGFFVALATDRLALAPEVRLFLAVGFLGSFTTFSSYAVESVALLRDSGVGYTMANILVNNVVALLAALFGAHLARVVG